MKPINVSRKLDEGNSIDMPGEAQEVPEEQVADNRRPSFGLGRVVMALFWLFSAWIAFDIVRSVMRVGSFDTLIIISILAEICYFLAAAGITHNGRRMRIVAIISVTIAAIAPVILSPEMRNVMDVHAINAPWLSWGSHYFYLPLILPVIGAVWLWWSNPRRIVELSEQLELPIRRDRQGKNDHFE